MAKEYPPIHVEQTLVRDMKIVYNDEVIAHTYDPDLTVSEYVEEQAGWYEQNASIQRRLRRWGSSTIGVATAGMVYVNELQLEGVGAARHVISVGIAGLGIWAAVGLRREAHASEQLYQDRATALRSLLEAPISS